ncbi:propionate catabolism operon regulatory protein PrpR [Pandoraea capi]|uniref:Propionate catabolism operon regulatory protein PrpR n=2 Tax=Pandoraea capi TaxID=2508286 RepID=A0ABY6WCC5_9BURK|nr:propionate catabolism operon regulatory protein PrpR [Pandoraea capi]
MKHIVATCYDVTPTLSDTPHPAMPNSIPPDLPSRLPVGASGALSAARAGSMPAMRKPVIWAVGISKLGELYRDIVPDYAAQAEVHIIDKGYEAVIEALERLPAGSVDGIVAAGSNGDFLRERLALPVVLVKVTGSDVMHALARARRALPSTSPDSRIALVSYARPAAEFERFKSAFHIDIAQHTYVDAQNAEDLVHRLRDEGMQVIVGPGLVTQLTERAGLTGIFLYSQDSVRAAFDTALEVARLGRIEAQRRERLDTVLRHLHEGVAAVDLNGRIEAINASMAGMLGVTVADAVGRPLDAIAPALDIARTLESASAELEAIVSMAGKTWVVNRIPLLDQGTLTGALLTCQDSQSFARVDRSLRSRHRPRHLVARYRLEDLIGDSAAMTQARALARRYAQTDSTVLVHGESGTGKELLAQGIHNASRRRDYPFVAINCAAFPETLLESELFGYEDGAFTGARRGGKAGLFETAHNGTLFLDEIGEMPMPLQTRLLRVLQEREVLRLGANEPIPCDVRVIAATHRDLRQQVAAGEFREDLYYRLNILRMVLPPLRERMDDLPRLTPLFLERALARAGARMSVDALQASLLPLLATYRWPGNVRELENLLERIAVVCADVVDAREVSRARLMEIAPELGARTTGPSPDVSGTKAERQIAALTGQDTHATQTPASLTGRERRAAEELARIHSTLAACGGDRNAACEALGISRSTLWRKLRNDA